MMHPDSLINSISQHMDSLETYLTSALLLAIITYWSGLMQRGQIEILGVKIEREYASFVSGAAFLFFNTSILFSLMRINALLEEIPYSHIEQALTALVTHKWLLNPYAFFGDSSEAQLIVGWEFGALIVIWWFGNTSFTLLQNFEKIRAEKSHRLALAALAVVFLTVGLLSMIAISSTYATILSISGLVFSEELLN